MYICNAGGSPGNDQGMSGKDASAGSQKVTAPIFVQRKQPLQRACRRVHGILCGLQSLTCCGGGWFGRGDRNQEIMVTQASVPGLGIPARLPNSLVAHTECTSHSYQPLWLSPIQPQPLEGRAIKRKLLGKALRFCSAGLRQNPGSFILSSILRFSEAAPGTTH